MFCYSIIAGILDISIFGIIDIVGQYFQVELWKGNKINCIKLLLSHKNPKLHLKL